MVERGADVDPRFGRLDRDRGQRLAVASDHRHRHADHADQIFLTVEGDLFLADLLELGFKPRSFGNGALGKATQFQALQQAAATALTFSRTALAIATALLFETILGRLVYGKIPNLASAYISGISVGILIRSPAFWPYALCALISITSKYVLRVHDRHIWNPSNFGIVAMFVLASGTVSFS